MSISSQCISCYWYIGDIGTGLACAAFPKGIPSKIFTGEFDHSLPYPGDYGIRWAESLVYTALADEIMEEQRKVKK
jgi:hypothetical protein